MPTKRRTRCRPASAAPPGAVRPIAFDRRTMLATTAFAAPVGCGLFAFTNPVSRAWGGVVVGGRDHHGARAQPDRHQPVEPAAHDW